MRSNMTKGALSSCACDSEELPGYGLGGLKKLGKKVGKKVGKVVSSPMKATYVFGKELAQGDVGDAFQKAGNVYGEAGKIVTPYVGLIPGIGVPLAAGVGAASAALAGDNRKQILSGAIKGGLSGYVGGKFGGAPGLLELGSLATTNPGLAGSIGLDIVKDIGIKPLVAGALGLAALKSPKVSGGSGTGGAGGAPPEQKDYYNLPTQRWDWNKLGADSSASGMALNEYIANNWNNVLGGQYNSPVQRSWAPEQTPGAMPIQYAAPAQQQQPAWMQTTPYQQMPPLRLARGGLSELSERYVQGAGSGREDAINARLSDGEYVMDAETVALLGDGSNKAGAQKLDQMREQIRKHKGQEMARGGFSKNAKSPLAYLKGAK